MTDIVRAEQTAYLPAPVPVPAADTLVGWARAAEAAHGLAVALCSTQFVPQVFQGKPGDGTAAILAGAEVGLSPLAALNGINVIKGKPAMSARTMAAVVLAAGHQVWTEESGPAVAVVCGRRRGSDHVERVEWTIGRAQQAGYVAQNAKYKTDPTAMLLARATSDLCRRLAPDALLGIAYSVEEIEDEQPATTTVTRAPAAGPRTVTRKPRPKAPEPVEPDLDDEPTPEPVSGGVNAETDPPAMDVHDEQPAVDHPAPAPDDPSAAADPTPDPEPTPARAGGITKAQQRMLFALMKGAGVTGRDDALEWLSMTLGRDVASSNDLTKDEAGRAIDELQRVADRLADVEAVAAEQADEPLFHEPVDGE